MPCHDVLQPLSCSQDINGKQAAGHLVSKARVQSAAGSEPGNDAEGHATHSAVLSALSAIQERAPAAPTIKMKTAKSRSGQRAKVTRKTFHARIRS